MNKHNWFKYGNDCMKCPCSWSSFGGEDWDGGCHIRDDDDDMCLVPIIIRRLRLRRAKYLQAHEYDGLYEWHQKQEKGDAVIFDTFVKELGAYEICRKDETGTYRPMNTKELSRTYLYSVRYAYDDFLFMPKESIWTRWRRLIEDMIGECVECIKSFAVGG
ncbi:hypothetical protein LJC42_00210 [Eubacteriales bacterium OttesenSCG-928-K08]|nr:hypothetical protein [Eubacteriales bacterium OttesenSCG-928-K08]